MIRYSLFFWAIFIFSATQVLALDITFKERIQATADHLVLGDIATFSDSGSLAAELAQKVVAEAPEAGQSTTLSARQIIRHILQLANVPSSTRWFGSASVHIDRPGTEITEEDILKHIDAYLTANAFRLPKATVHFTPRSKTEPFFVPVGKQEWQIVPSDPDIIGSGSFAVIIKVDGRVGSNLSINGKLTAVGSVILATQDMSNDEILTREKITMVNRDLFSYSAPLRSLDDLVGKRLRHSMRKGTVIEKNDVEFLPLIQKGQIVRILIKKGPLLLSASGMARASGLLHDIIRVQNLSSKKLIFCRITAPGTVEVII